MGAELESLVYWLIHLPSQLGRYDQLVLAMQVLSCDEEAEPIKWNPGIHWYLIDVL